MRHERDEFEPSQDRWLVSYADFMTLMFAFFVIMFATAESNSEKTEQLQESIKRFLIRAGAFGESGQQVHQGEKLNTPIEQPIQTFRQEKTPSTQTLDEAEAWLESQLTKEERARYLVDVASDDWGVRLTLLSKELYGVNSEKFREDALPFLKKVATLLAQTKRKVLVEGHVASGEMGSAKSVWDFASARAVMFVRFMQKTEGLKSERLAAATLADSRPLKPGFDSRIEVVLLNSDMEL